jgi:mycothiol system anti-sigma-R factor
MADCSEILGELDRYLDDELDSGTIREMQGHLNGCVDCQQAFEFHAELRTLIRRAASDEPLPPTLLARIRECFGDDSVGDDAR